VLLTSADGGHWIIRAPRNPAAQAQQAADLVALAALTPGVRSRLPFAVPNYAGQAPLGPTTAVVYDFVFGSPVALADLTPTLAESIGRAIAAIHSLPSSVVGDASLPMLSSTDAQDAAISIVNRAAATGRVPVTLIDRWEQATSDAGLWQYQPTVINGALGGDSLLIADETVSGVLGWADLRVGDPAADLKWLLAGVHGSIADIVLDTYAEARQVAFDQQVRQRTMFYAELELARWLLHGSQVGSTEIMDDAADMMDKLVDKVNSDLTIGPVEHEPLDVDQVEELLDSQPPISRPAATDQ